MIEAPTETVIEISNLTTAIGSQIIHQNLDLTVRRGEILAIVGGSGSGKTTLLRAILMLMPILRGKIKVMGIDLETATEIERQKVRQYWGVMFQHGALFSSLTVLENVAFPLQEHSTLSLTQLSELAKLKLALVGFSVENADKFPSELSGGMQKRASLARAIALDPALLFLDEPTAGLDPQGASGLDELVLNLKMNLGLTIVMITHDVDTLWRVADRVAFLGDKRVLQVGTMKELVNSDNQIIKNYFNDPRSRAAEHIREEVR